MPQPNGKPMKQCTPERIESCRLAKRQCRHCPPMPAGGWAPVLRQLGYKPPPGLYEHPRSASRERREHYSSGKSRKISDGRRSSRKDGKSPTEDER